MLFRGPSDGDVNACSFVAPQIPEALFIFSQPVSSCGSSRVTSAALSSGSMTLPSAVSSAAEPAQRVLCFGFVLLSSHISI